MFRQVSTVWWQQATTVEKESTLSKRRYLFLTICLGLFRFLYLFCLRPFTERQFNYSNKRTKVNLGVLGSVWLLLGPPLLDVIEADAERDRSSQKGHESALLKLVGQDRGVRFAGWPDCKSEIK